MTKRCPNKEFNEFMSVFYDNLKDVIATEKRRPGYTTTLEFISISGEHYFPEKEAVLRLENKAVGFFNAAAVFLAHYQPEKIKEVIPQENDSSRLRKRLVASGLNNIEALLKK